MPSLALGPGFPAGTTAKRRYSGRDDERHLRLHGLEVNITGRAGRFELSWAART